MMQKKFMGVALAALTVLAWAHAVQAAPPAPTAIVIPDMDCNGCAKLVTKKMMAVQGVARCQADVKNRVMWVFPKDQVALSPRDIWNAAEEAGKSPTKIQGPSGTFTAKP